MENHDDDVLKKIKEYELRIKLHIPKKYLESIKNIKPGGKIESLQEPIEEVTKTFDLKKFNVSAKLVNDQDMNNGLSTITIAVTAEPKLLPELQENEEFIPEVQNYSYKFDHVITSKKELINYLEKSLNSCGIKLDKHKS